MGDALPDQSVWHVDGPVAQILAMAEWTEIGLDSGSVPSVETMRKIAANLRAAAVKVVPASEVDLFRAENEALKAAIAEHLAEIEARWDGSDQSPLWGLPDALEAALQSDESGAAQ